MGVAVSGWPLARAVSQAGQLGVVSGTALDMVIARRLQLGDLGGHIRHALDHFPIAQMAQRIKDAYFIPGGKPENKPFKSRPMGALKPPQALVELTVVANFVEVFLAKHGHDGPVGINLLEKIQLPTVPSLFGAMMAGVDYVLMGAGIPRHIPGVLDKLARMEVAELPIDVQGALPGESYTNRFDPVEFCQGAISGLKRPAFLAIVSSGTLAQMLAKKCTGKVDGFVIEGPTAGGHNAPPRGQLNLSEEGEPVYGPRDVPDLAQFRELGLPFWMAGSYGSPEGLKKAVAEGAQGVQVGTAFALCDESGMDPTLKARALARSAAGTAHVHTDPLASPTGFPFKVVELTETVSQKGDYEARNRICDLGYLRSPYRLPDGKIGYRCAAEPIEDYVKKGGCVEDTQGRKCICNGLAATIGQGQVRKDGYHELPVVTGGDDIVNSAKFLKPGQEHYSAADVIEFILEGLH